MELYNHSDFHVHYPRHHSDLKKPNLQFSITRSHRNNYHRSRPVEESRIPQKESFPWVCGDGMSQETELKDEKMEKSLFGISNPNAQLTPLSALNKTFSTWTLIPKSQKHMIIFHFPFGSLACFFVGCDSVNKHNLHTWQIKDEEVMDLPLQSVVREVQG